MRLGINYWSFAPDTPMVEAIETASRAGFEGLELCLAEEGDVSVASTPSQLRDLRQRAEDHGLELPSLASWLVWENNLVSDDPAVRSRARDIIHRQIDVAHELGATTILVVPGYVGVDFVSPSEVVDYEAAYERAGSAIRDLAPTAAAAGVEIGVENVWNKFLLSPLEMRRFIDDIGHGNVGVYFDIGNVLLTGYPDQWISILDHRIKAVHAKDYRRDPGGFEAFVDLLAGDVDFPAVTSALRRINYTGYITAEMMPTYTHYTDQMILNTGQSLRRIVNSPGT